ncbi:MAG: choice-of-anchor J domain-containing protein [Pseudomonadota bacterium]
MKNNKMIVPLVMLLLLLLCPLAIVGIASAASTSFLEDFEAGIGDWWTDNGMWEVGTPTAGPDTAHSGSKCAGTVLGGNYSNNQSSRFISPTMILPSVSDGEEIRFRFWQWFSFGVYYYWDYGQVEIAVYDDTAKKLGDWATIGDPINYDNTIWTENNIEITQYAGKKVRFAFHLVNNNDGATSFGWYVDDVQIVSNQGAVWVFQTDTDNDGVPDTIDECPNTLAGSCVDNKGCASSGTYTQAQVDQLLKNVLAWGDTNEDGKIGLSEAINALQITAGIKTK